MQRSSYIREVLASPVGWITLVAANVAYIFMTRVERPFVEARLMLQEDILEGSALEPFRFRVLVPFLGDLGQNLSSSVLPEEWGHLLTFFFLNFLFLWATLWNIWNFNQTLPVQGKIISIFSFGFAANIGLFDHYYQPWSLLEAAIVSTAFRFAVRGKFGWLPVLTLFGTLNRDTGVILPLSLLLFLLLTKQMEAKKLALVLFSGLVGGGTFIALRILIGPAEQVTPIEQVLEMNLAAIGLLKFSINIFLMFGLGWFLVTWGGRTSPYRSIWLSFLPYLALIVVFGVWLEVRLLLPLVWLLSIQIGEALSQVASSLGVEPRENNGGDERI